MVSKIMVNDAVVCVVGLGYVGMPLAEAFAKHVRVIGFDINEKKIIKLAGTSLKSGTSKDGVKKVAKKLGLEAKFLKLDLKMGRSTTNTI